MSENLKTSGSGIGDRLAVDSQLGGSLSNDVLARRRMLLASLGKGAAVAAAVGVPMQSLAAIGTLAVTADGRRCTMSGNMSAVHSNETIKALCTGKRSSFYATISNWPNYNIATNPGASNLVNGGSGTFNKDTPFNTLFPGGSSTTLINVLTTDANSAESHWITALLNGTANSLSVNFPYTAAQVIGFYNVGGTARDKALMFFTGFMETT